MWDYLRKQPKRQSKSDEIVKQGRDDFKINRLGYLIYWLLRYETWKKLITFKLLTIEIPTGKGKRVNKKLTVDSKRGIIQITNKDTICSARALIVRLTAHHKQKLKDIFRSNLTKDELKQINKNRQSKLQINEGIISDNYIKKAEGFKQF